MGSKYILETKGLNVGYGPIHVLYDLDFKVPDGEVTIVVGPNGVGKTTLLKALMGLATVYSGDITFEGQRINEMPAYERTKRQMLAEGMVLMRDPKIMVVDEPTAGLMPKLVTDVMKQLKAMADETGLPIVLVEQRARRALAVGDYAYMMRGGRFTFEGGAQELLNHPQLEE
jgi:ABC-type branched-subunit amino acid transport system ATPase component